MPKDAGDPLAALDSALNPLSPTESTGCPFGAGWIGYLPYDCGEVLQGVQPIGSATIFPRMALYDSLAIFDHQTNIWSVTAAELTSSRRPAADRLDELERLLRRAADASVPPDLGDTARHPATTMPTADISPQNYLQKVRRAKAHIEAGDIYQVNLTQRFTARAMVDPLTLYLRLRRSNPSDFGACLIYPDRALLSCSPELFLSVNDGQVLTRPIKGTAPRDLSRISDDERVANLLNSEKDRAELNMIIDLLRNDLGRVCEYGSIRVINNAEVERHPTVLHLVATIEGRLRDRASLVDLLRATFPGGSVTGCPKIRAMQIIRELEDYPRDVYCGSIGYIGLDGRMVLSVAIRTMLMEAGKVYVYAGGAITADSDPRAEYRETLAKAAGMLRACGHSITEFDSAATAAAGSGDRV
jgi:para-aminobenzoate synthetase component 1